jgi:hypothetical protein
MRKASTSKHSAHPQGTPEIAATGRLKGNGVLENVIGNPLETTIALSHLIFEGTLDSYPGIKICAAQLADICVAQPDRFVGLASVALQHPELAAEQLEYAVKQLGLRGALIGGSVNGEEPSPRRSRRSPPNTCLMRNFIRSGPRPSSSAC